MKASRHSLSCTHERLTSRSKWRDVYCLFISPQVNFYRHVVPALEALQAELKVPDAERIHVFPKLFGARIGSSEDRVDDDAILVLENLAATGYRCGSRFEGLDLAHCSLAVRINQVF